MWGPRARLGLSTASLMLATWALAAPVRAQTDAGVASSDAATPIDAASASAPVEPPEVPPVEAEGDGLIFNVHVGPGEYQFRGNALSDMPLQPAGPRALGERPVGPTLGQNWFAEQWLRAGFSMTLSDHRDASHQPVPFLTLFGQMDLLWGVAFGDLAQGTSPAAYPRDQYGYPASAFGSSMSSGARRSASSAPAR